MLMIELEPESEQRIARHARSSGVSEAEFLRTLIENSLDDLDDIQIAAERLKSSLPQISAAEAHRRLGLDNPV